MYWEAAFEMNTNFNIYFFRILLTSVFFSAVNYTKATDVDIAFKDNKIQITTPEITIKNGEFSVYVLEGDQPLVLKPFGDPIISEVIRETPAGRGKQTVYTWTDHRGYKYSWLVMKIGDDIVSIRSRFTNGSLKPVQLKKFFLLKTPGQDVSVTGQPSEWMLSTTSVECRRWGTLDKDIPTSKELESEGAYSSNLFKRRGIVDPERVDSRAWRSYHNDASLYKSPGTKGLTMSAVDTISYVYYDMKVEEKNIRMEVISDMNVLVDPGEFRTSDEVLLIYKPWREAQLLKNEWLVNRVEYKLTKKPAFGWCSWYRQKMGFDEQIVSKVVENATQNYNKIPHEVIQLDDHFQNNDVEWMANKRFSSGMESMARKITDAGMVAGIWLCPATINNQKTEGLNELLASRFTDDCFIGKSYFGRIKMDPTHPKVRAYIRETLRKYYDQGYRYFKLDFTQWPLREVSYNNPKLTAFQVQRDLYRQFRSALGQDSYILACGIMGERPIFDYVDASRIGTDCGPMSGFARKPFASDGQPVNIHGLWYPIIAMANKNYENGLLCNADPDVAYVGLTGKTRPAQLQTYHSFIGLFGGLTMTSEQMFRPEFDRTDNYRMLEILYPVVEEKGINFAGGWDLYGKEFGTLIQRSYGNAINLILWNPKHDGPASLTMRNISTDDIGKKFHAWSFWDETYKGIITKDYVARDILSYEHELLRLTPISDKPILIGSNLHVAMGAVEIKSINLSGSKISIELDPNAGCRNGRLYFYSEQPLSNASSTNSDVLLIKKEDNIYVLVLSDRNRSKAEIITMDILKEKLPTIRKVMNDPKLKDIYVKSSFTEAWEKSW